MPTNYLNAQAFHAGVWGNAPLVERQFDQSIAVWLDEQFEAFNTVSTTGSWVSTQATSGTAAISTTVPGALLLDAGATTQHQGIQIQRTKSAFIPAAGKSLWFEALVTLTAASPPVTKAQLFVGLAAVDTTIIASGAQTTNNRLGFQILTTANLTAQFTADKAGTGTTGTGLTFTPATAAKLGFFYDGNADTVQPFVNGVATGTAIPTANIPKVAVYPSIVCQSDGTDQPQLLVQGLRVLQLR